MGFLDEERKRLLNQKESGGSGNGSALSFLDRERTRLNTGLSLSPDGQSKLKAQQQRKTTVESKVPNIGDPTAALRNLPKQIQDGMAGPDPGPNASQEERDAWAMKKMKEDVAKIQREKNQKAAAPPAPAPQKNGFFDTIGNLFNPKSYSPDNIPKNLETPQLKPVREALGFAENTVDSATFGALPFAFDQARKIPGSQYLLNSQANTDITSRAAKAQEGTALGTTADLLGALAPYAGAYKATGGLARTLNAGRGPIASNFVRGTLAGAAYGAANETGEAAFGKNNQSFTGRLQDIGISAALGGAGDAAVSAALPFLGRAAQKYLPGFRSTPDAPANPLALPPGRSPGVQNRMNAAAQRSVNAPGTTPIIEPYQFGLPEASPISLRTANNASSARKELDSVAAEVKALQDQYERQVVQEFQYLKQSMQSRGGVQQGQIIRDHTGDVVDRVGRQSSNPEWYQEFFRINGRAPTNRDLYTLARDRVENGFQTETGRAPAWVDESGYREGMEAYKPVLDSLRSSLRELDPAIRVTDSPLATNRLQDTRLAGRPVPPRQGVQSEAAPTQAPNQSVVPEAAPSRPTATVEAYDRALANGDTEAMRQIAPDIAEKMAAYPGDLSQIPTFLRGKMYNQLGINKRAPSNLPREADLAPSLKRTPEPMPAATPSRLPERLSPEPAPMPQNPMQARPIVPRVPESPLAANADIPLGPDLDGGLGISAGLRNNDPYFVPSNDTRSQIVSRNSRVPEGIFDPATYKAAGDRLYQNFIDDLSPIAKKIDSTMERVLGRKLDAAESPHKLALAGRGRDMTARQIIDNGMVDSQGQVIGKSLKEVLSPIRTQKENVKFEDYLLNRHAITRAGRGEKVFRDQLNWTPQEGANKIAAYERDFPAFKQAADDLYTFQKQLVDNWLVDSGMISRQQADAWFSENPFYVPNKRFFSDLEKTGNTPGGGGGRGVASTSNPVKGYSKTGSQRKIISPIEAIVENVDAYVKVADRNKTMQQIYKFVTTYPDDFADFATIIRKQDENLPTNDLEALVADIGRDFDKGTQVFKMDTDNIVRVQVNGNTLRMKINDKPFLEALTAMGPQGSGWLLDTIGSVTNFFKKYTTGSNPFFAFTRNLPRDFVQGYVSSKTTSNPFKYFGDYFQSIGDILFNRDAYQLYKNIGGGHSSSVSADRNLLAQSKRQLVGKKGPLNQIGRVNDAYDNVMNAVESAPRVAEFKRTMKNGGTTKQGLFEASDVTVNFKRKGRLARDIDKVFPYFNAAMQGLDQLGRLYANPATRGKAIAKGIVSLSIPTAVLYTMNRNDPNYQQLPDRQKDNYFHIPKGDGTFWKVAKPRELGTIFSDVIERGMRDMDGEGNEAFRGFMEQLRVAFLPPGLSGLAKDTDISDRLLGDTIAAPFTQLGANKNFAGSPIVPGYLERLSPELQRDAKTSKIGETLAGLPVLGKIADNSPKKADFLIKAYTGWVGQFGTAATSPGVGLGKALEQQVSVDPTFSNDISNELYDYKTLLDQAYADREYRELPSWYDDIYRKYLNKVSSDMSDIRGLMREVQEDSSLGNQEKTEQLREMQEWLNEMGEEANANLRGVIPRK